ncbi:hypothetical protein RO3G_17369 [Rhizopus delemar RA 99-880]|uniref:HTH CENPB-type domain-containing protein n=2 Tax=Rhizopus delemar (strain RA 99-880 / ATCC MYA-4621 / FGSC 9543 / NRRL 43880) TaxID=246409 RepID=I1CW28_RHIO9|nr:hypothetical protein RO3G_17369 [Rhizopus delemar RA 99-880]|eukprot:EIE92658.1 hypothetical protein RO3G_17369 [Rhizopus delemar RA 99-880]
MSNNKRVRLSISQKIELLDQNATGQLNQTELGEWAMKKFNLDQPLAQQTISNILKNAETLYSNVNVVKNSKSPKTTRYPQLDDEVEKFVADMNNSNLPVNRDSILRYVRHIAQVKYRIPGKEISFSSGWLTKLFKRIGVRSRPMYGESASVDISSENIQNELRKIEELLEPYDPVDIMNFDETGLYYQQPPRRTICSESLGGLKKSKTRLTVGLLCNSDGSYKGHPVVIGQHKSPKCFKTRANLLSMTAIGKKHEVEYHYSTNAWMTNEIFTAYVKKLDVAFGRQNGKIALLLDNASVHKTKIPLNNCRIPTYFKHDSYSIYKKSE